MEKILKTIDSPEDIEIKLSTRYVVKLPKELEIESYFVNEVELPKLVNKEWQNMNIKFINTIPDSIAQKLLKLIDQNTLFSYTITMHDPVGIIVEKWLITVKKIVGIDFGNLSYNKSDLIISTLTIKPESCVMIKL